MFQKKVVFFLHFSDFTFIKFSKNNFTGIRTAYFSWVPSEIEIGLLRKNPRRRMVTNSSTIGKPKY